METVPSLQEENDMKLVIENIAKAVSAWCDDHDNGTEAEAVMYLHKTSGLSVGLIRAIKNYKAGNKNRPNPSLDNINALMNAIGCKTEFHPRHKFDE